MDAQSIRTVGDFSILTGHQLDDLPVIQPKMLHAQEVLEKYDRAFSNRKTLKGTITCFYK